MRIGFTYDLREAYQAMGLSGEEVAEFDRAETVDAIAAALSSLGHGVDRIGNIQDLCLRLTRGERWDLVWNACEGRLGRARESQVPCLLDAHGLPYVFSTPDVLAICLNKGMTKLAAARAGVPTAPFVVLDDVSDLEKIAAFPGDGPFFLKPLSEGSGKGISERSIVDGRRALKERCAEMLAGCGQALIVEEYLPGREFTVGILGSGAGAELAGVLEVDIPASAQGSAYSYHYKYVEEDPVAYRLADDAAARLAGEYALAAWKALGCRDAGRLDFRLDGTGAPMLIEVNPLAGMDPYHSDLPRLCAMGGISYGELIRRILASAAQRL